MAELAENEFIVDSEEAKEVFKDYFIKSHDEEPGEGEDEESMDTSQVSFDIHSDSEDKTPLLDTSDQRKLDDSSILSTSFNSAELINEEVNHHQACPCSCAKGKGKTRCITQFTNKQISNSRLSVVELDDDCRDAAILSMIQAGFNASEMTSSKKQIPRMRKNPHTSYYFLSKPVCLSTISYIYCVGKSIMQTLRQHFQETGGITLRHKKKKNNWRNVTFQQCKMFKSFMKNFIEQYALVLPGRMSKFSRYVTEVLPSHLTKAKIYEVYKSSLPAGEKSLSHRYFSSLWKDFFPSVTICKPMSDLCWTCQRNNAILYHSSMKTQKEKQTALAEQTRHLKDVKVARDHYRSCISHARDSNQAIAHISFDMAQQVHYPSDPLQPGPIYFKDPRACGVFGVTDETVPCQTNYLIDEGVCTGKGANAVISYVHHYLENCWRGRAKRLVVHADNCAGQNKNDTMLMYLVWRVLMGYHDSVELNFMVAGHTKFGPDWFFGMFKKRFRVTFVSSLEEMKQCVESSSQTNEAILVGDESGTIYVPSYDWKEFFSSYFHKVPGIKKCQQFSSSASIPGRLEMKLSCSSEKAEIRDILIEKPAKTAMPPVIPPPGLSYERQEYLYSEIREFCKEEVKDLVCPKPLPRNKENKQFDDEDMDSAVLSETDEENDTDDENTTTAKKPKSNSQRTKRNIFPKCR